MKYAMLLLFATISLSAQQQVPTAEKCISAIEHNRLMLTDRVYANKMHAFESAMKRTAHRDINSDPVLTIPVVVHIIHKGEAIGVGSNISDQAVYDKIKAVNDNFRKTIGTDGYGNGVDTGIEFALAVRTPAGLCTNGIERIDMSSNPAYVTYGYRYLSANGITYADLIAASTWDHSAYYNIYLVSEIDNNEGGNGTLGFASFATSHGQPGDGMVAVSNQLHAALGNTESHELGHALNLYHTFEGDGTFGTACPAANGCGPAAGDCCADTPPHMRSNISCTSSGTNACDNNSSNALFVSNYMNYTFCMDMFTADQKSRMRTALQTLRASFLAENGNTSLIPVGSPVANYLADAQVICAGQSIRFTDRSSCIANSYSGIPLAAGVSFNWVFTNGSTTITSTQQNPVLQFTVPGVYQLNYTVTNAFGTNTLNVPAAITVNATAILSCIPTSDFVGQAGYSILNVLFNTISNHTPQGHSQGYRDFSCTGNTTVNAGGEYWLELKASSGAAGLYAVAYIDYNNNAAFEAGEKIFEAQLTPFNSLSQYTTSVIIPANAVNNTFLRMRIIGSSTPITSGLLNCNSSYAMGDVEDYAVRIVDPLTNKDFDTENFRLYPNPAKDKVTITGLSAIEHIQIYSGLGQLVFENDYAQKEVVIDTSRYSKGVYLIAVAAQGKHGFYKLIKE